MLKLKFDSVEKVMLFVNICNEVDFDVDCKIGRFMVDGKSLFGVLSLDLSQPVEILTQNEITEARLKQRLTDIFNISK